ncbi:epimerase [Polaromonas sp. P1(28)-8]|nr:epimerase [Polaromonas sp. P1(28)-8]
MARLLADKAYSTVCAVGRRAPDLQHARLVVQVTDSFSEFTAPAVDDVFIALGTTIKVAGSREAFRNVDFDAVVAVARAARAAGATRLGVVSAMGADSRSPVFYNRVKGEMEETVLAMGFETIVIARPSLLAGDRASLRQAQRPGEKWALAAMTLFKPLIPNNYRSIPAADVAAALITAVQAGQPGRRILLSGEMQPR